MSLRTPLRAQEQLNPGVTSLILSNNGRKSTLQEVSKMFKGMRLEVVPREKRLRPILTESRLLKIKKIFKESMFRKTKCLRSRGFVRL